MGVFEGGRTYTIVAKLVQSNDSQILLSVSVGLLITIMNPKIYVMGVNFKDSINVTVKKRGFTATLIPESVLIGISRPLELRLLYSDLDNSGSKPNVGTCNPFALVFSKAFMSKWIFFIR